MYTVSIIGKNIVCDTPEKAQECANLYWHRDPVIVENATGRIVPVRLTVPGAPESEY